MVEFKKIVHAFNRLRSRAVEDERKGYGDFSWQQYETPLSIYEETFARMLSIRSFLKERNSHGDTYVMDFMGAGKAVRDLAEENLINGGLSVTLNDFRSPELVMSDESIGCEVLGENILYGTTIRHIREWIDRKNPTGSSFDLIMCNPGNGFVSFSGSPIGKGMIEYIYQKGTKMLNPNGGVMIVNLPMSQLYSVDMDDWVKKANESKEGLEVSYAPAREYNNGEYIMKVVRNS